MDGLSASLGRLRAGDCTAGEAVVHTPWAVHIPQGCWDVIVYLVTGAGCQLLLRDRDQPTTILGNSVVVITGGAAHAIEGAEVSQARRAAHADRAVAGRFLTRVAEWNDTATRIRLVGVAFDSVLGKRLLSMVPPSLVLTYAALPAWVLDRFGQIRAELEQASATGYASALRDSEALILGLLGEQARLEPLTVPPSWRAATDPRLARLQAAIHSDLARRWSLDSIASEIGMSRSRLAAKASAYFGESAMSYVSRCRMLDAALQLEATQHDMNRIARSVGYLSEKAFATSFLRFWHLQPSAFRRSARSVRRGSSPID